MRGRELQIIFGPLVVLVAGASGHRHGGVSRHARMVARPSVSKQSLAQRAALRATDENVPQALSGYRPKLVVTASGG